MEIKILGNRTDSVLTKKMHIIQTTLSKIVGGPKRFRIEILPVSSPGGARTNDDLIMLFPTKRPITA